MSNRHHLPAGQNLQGPPGVDMSGGPRRRQQPPPQYAPQYHPHMNPMYQNYVPYAPQQYYGVPPPYQNGAMASPGYMPYQNYARSPPNMQQYVPMVGVSVPPAYPRAAPRSPALSTPYLPPPVQAPILPQTPSSTHSGHFPPSPTPPAPQPREPVPAPAPARSPSPVIAQAPFRPPLPWLSRPDVGFPTKSPRFRRRRRLLNADSASVSLPVEQHEASADQNDPPSQKGDATGLAEASKSAVEQSEAASQTATPKDTSATATPATSTSPTSARADANTGTTPTKTLPSQARPTGPATPLVPALPKAASKPAAAKPQGENKETTEPSEPATQTTESGEAASSESEAAPAPVKAPPSSWAKLFAKAAGSSAAGQNGQAAPGSVNGSGDGPGVTGLPGSSFTKANASSLAEAIRAYRVDGEDKLSFLEPRGLINTGNMCYMNSVLQVLMFCVPFYDFLVQVSNRAAHSFKSDTPLVDAIIMFMHEFKVIKSGSSIEQLRRSLKAEELERYGEPFTPEFVYDAIRQLPRFASMRRGHQQDAEEFLGFLLQSLDDECTQVMNNLSSTATETGSVDSPADESAQSGDWLEVGRKQRAAVTRSSGSNSGTPITKIFGGLLRSEFRVPGLKDSITTEPYQPLQLDIGSPDVRNVVDALRGLTRPERLQGDFNSPRGKDVSATKQVFIESLPPVLILHLKRFQFDAEGHGTVKIWKKVGYPLELEIPREALSRQTRQTIGEKHMPRYKLISVVYHHGKNASGGHYTVDVRRQEGDEWLRLDDTVLRRVRSDDVAEVGSEEEVKEVRKEAAAQGPGNRFGAIDEDGGDEDGWKQITTTAGGNKRWSSVVNGANPAPKGKQVKDSIKDNKVAYLLFYQRV